jgi:hypothetical protein
LASSSNDARFTADGNTMVYQGIGREHVAEDDRGDPLAPGGGVRVVAARSQ